MSTSSGVHEAGGEELIIGKSLARQLTQTVVLVFIEGLGAELVAQVLVAILGLQGGGCFPTDGVWSFGACLLYNGRSHLCHGLVVLLHFEDTPLPVLHLQTVIEHKRC